MSTIFHQPCENDNENLCSICLENINNEQNYILPECGHCFHTNCIMHWFRSGNTNCPYCNNNGINSTLFRGRYSIDRYKLLRRVSRNKNAPKQLKNIVNNLKKLEKQYSENKKAIKNISEKEGVFKILKKEINKLESKNRQINIKIRQNKRRICDVIIIQPLLLVKKLNK